MRIGKWRRSQTSNGYYMKTSSGKQVTIFMQRTRHGNGFVYSIERKDRGDGSIGVPYNIGVSSTLDGAKKWMYSYMKAHPYGW